MSELTVITGMGTVTPLGVGAETLYARWRAGDLGIVDGEGACRDFDASEFLSRREVRSADRFAQMATVAAAEALDQAGWSEEPPYDPDRIGVVLATSVGGIKSCIEQQDRVREKGADYISPLAVTMQMPNAAAAMIAQRYGFRGECCALVAACASGTMAFGAGRRLLADGTLDAVLIGGADAAITLQVVAAFRVMGALSRCGIARPFDRRRDGFIIGEGAGAVVLERASAARERGAAALAEVIGFGASTDAYHVSAPEPSGRTAAIAIQRALACAGIGPDDVDYVNAHGTASQLNDQAETRALKAALGDRAYEIPISSTKSTIGHLMGAAGMVEAVATVLALRDRVAPPTLGLEEPDDELDLNYVPGRPQPLAATGELVAISNSFGLGGHNAVVALRVR
ncbi:MAG: beta-ketoacyl-[acyl-carrier-protein] synthase family protein [Solirubrobacteraceae bacterium]